MCFTPTISLLTALFEWSVAVFLLYRYKGSVLTRFFAVFLFVLGFYQFTEFLLCITPYASFFARLGFATYTFLPALGVHFSAYYTGAKKVLKTVPYLYALPVAFGLFSFLEPGFVLHASCQSVFVFVETLLFSPVYVLHSVLYYAYYFGYIAVALVLLVMHLAHKHSKLEGALDLVMLFAIIFSALPPLLLAVIIPSLGLVFPSMYCQFAILFAILVLFESQFVKKIRR